MARASLKNQISYLLKSNLYDQMSLEEKKNVASGRNELKEKELGYTETIYGYQTYETYLNICVPFAEWAKQKYSIKKVNQITKEMIIDYFAYKRSSKKWNSAWTETTAVAAINKLNKAGQEMGWIKGDGFRIDSVMRKRLKVKKRRLKDRKKGGRFTNEEIQKIKENVPKATRKFIEFVENTGARQEGCQKVKVKDINWEEKTIRFKEKGGKTRHVPLNDKQLEYLKKITKGKEPEENILPNRSRGTIQNDIRKACEKLGYKSRGLHGSRGTYAQNLYNSLIEKSENQKSSVSESSCRGSGIVTGGAESTIAAKGGKITYRRAAVEEIEDQKNQENQTDHPLSEEEAKSRVSQALGHGEKRFDVLKNYQTR